jgi:transcriptional regulator with XRE-family HTH domain
MKSAVLAKQLRDARRELGFTQKDIGEIIGVTRQVVTCIESGTQNVTLETIEKLAAALDYDIKIELKQKKRSQK